MAREELGGTKKKSISQAEKAQGPQEGTSFGKQEKKSQPGKEGSQPKQPRTVMPYLDEGEVEKVFGPMKAITIYNAAKSLGLNASVTSALLRYLEDKNLIERVGGYSGHYVWRVTGPS